MDKFNAKILLFGEYSLLYNSMALTMPYENYYGSWSKANSNNSLAKHSNDCLKKFSHFLSNHQDNHFELDVKAFENDVANGMFYDSNIPQGSGLGSSGALVTAVFTKYIKFKSNLKQLLSNLTAENVERLRLALGKIESFFHGASSGIDPLSILLNKPLLYQGQDEITITQLPQPNEKGNNFIFLLNTKLERNTDELVKRFKIMCEENSFKSKLNNELIPTTNACIQNFLSNKSELYKNLSQLIEFQLCNLSYLIPSSFQEIVKKGLETEDYYLKVCGAGGGGFILGFTQNWAKTKQILNKHQLELIYKY